MFPGKSAQQRNLCYRSSCCLSEIGTLPRPLAASRQLIDMTLQRGIHYLFGPGAAPVVSGQRAPIRTGHPGVVQQVLVAPGMVLKLNDLVHVAVRAHRAHVIYMVRAASIPGGTRHNSVLQRGRSGSARHIDIAPLAVRLSYHFTDMIIIRLVSDVDRSVQGPLVSNNIRWHAPLLVKSLLYFFSYTTPEQQVT